MEWSNWIARALGWCQLNKCQISTWWWDPLWFGLWANPTPSFSQSFLALPSLCSVPGRWGWGTDLCRLHFEGLCPIWFLAGFGQRGHWWEGVEKSRGNFSSFLCTPSHWSTNSSNINPPIFHFCFMDSALWNTEY